MSNCPVCESSNTAFVTYHTTTTNCLAEMRCDDCGCEWLSNDDGQPVDLNKDLTIQIKSIRTEEVVSLTLKHDVKCRYTELGRVVGPYGEFNDERGIWDGDEHVANLISSSEDLTDWCWNDPEMQD